VAAGGRRRPDRTPPARGSCVRAAGAPRHRPGATIRTGIEMSRHDRLSLQVRHPVRSQVRPTLPGTVKHFYQSLFNLIPNDLST